MPVTTTTYPELDLTIFTTTGKVSVDQQKQVLKSFYENEPTRNVIWNFSLLEEVSASSSELREIILYAKQFSDRRTGGCTALIVDTQLKYGLARMASTFAEIEHIPWSIRAFEKLDEAMAWISENNQPDNKRSQAE